MNVGKAIKQIRQIQGLSIYDCAKKCTIDPTELVDIEDGGLKPDEEMIEYICKGLGIKEDVLKAFGIEQSDFTGDRKYLYKEFIIPMQDMMKRLASGDPNKIID